MTITHLTIDAAAHVSYATLAQADAYLNVDPVREVAWELLSDADKSKKLVAATRRLDLLTWQGEKTGVALGSFLIAAANATDADTVTIDTKVYTFQTTLTDVDGNVLIGVDVGATRDNLVAAIIRGPGAATTYAALTTIHPTVTAAVGSSAGGMIVKAKTSGSAGDAIATTETGANLSWLTATLAGGGIAANQENAWPRTGLNKDGADVPETEVPKEIENATILLAGTIAITAATADAGTSGTNTKSVKAGSAAVSFFRQQAGKALQDETAFDLVICFLEASAISSELGPLASGVDGESTFSDIDQWGRNRGFP